MAARCHTLKDRHINSLPDKLLSQRQCGGEADDLRTAGLDRFNAAFGRKSASQHHMPDLMSRENVDEVENLRMHGDEVYAERLDRELLRFGDFRIKQFRRHRAARNHPKTTKIGRATAEKRVSRYVKKQMER